MDTVECKQDISIPQLMSMENVKMKFVVQDSKYNKEHEHMSTFKTEVKEEQMDHASFKPTSITNKRDISVKCEMKKELTEDSSPSSINIMPLQIQFSEGALKTDTTDVYKSDSCVKCEMKKELTEDFSQSAIKIMPHPIHLRQRQRMFTRAVI